MGVQPAANVGVQEISSTIILKPLLHNNSFNLTLVFSLALLALSSFNYGFDVQAMAAAQAMTPFTKQFGRYMTKTHTWKIEPYFLSLLNSCHAPAQIFGRVPDHFGY